MEQIQETRDVRELSYELITDYDTGVINFNELVQGLRDLGLKEEDINSIIAYYEV